MRRTWPFLLLVTVSCHDKKLPATQAVPATYFTAERSATRFTVADDFLAGIEMQISGEPFAQLLDRDIAAFNRFDKVTDQYKDPNTGVTLTDVLGYAAGVESYEYSKQP